MALLRSILTAMIAWTIAPFDGARAQYAVIVDQATIWLNAPVAVAEPAVEEGDEAEEAKVEVKQEAAVFAEPAAVDAVVVEAAVVVQGQLQLAVPVANADADEDAQLAPYLAQFRPVLKTELSFAHRVCQFSDEQKAKAIEQGKAKLMEFVRDYFKQQHQPQAAGVFFGIGGLVAPQPQLTSPRSSLEDEIAKLINEIADDLQREKYEAERKLRNGFRREAALENVVSMVDSKLLLAPEQRQEINESLQKNWDDGWAPALDALVHMGEYLPQIPDERVVDHLNDEQKSVWQGIQKVNYGSSFFGGDSNWIDGGQQMNDIDLGE